MRYLSCSSIAPVRIFITHAGVAPQHRALAAKGGVACSYRGTQYVRSTTGSRGRSFHVSRRATWKLSREAKAPATTSCNCCRMRLCGGPTTNLSRRHMNWYSVYTAIYTATKRSTSVVTRSLSGMNIACRSMFFKAVVTYGEYGRPRVRLTKASEPRSRAHPSRHTKYKRL